jgi:hypothetical protein
MKLAAVVVGVSLLIVVGAGCARRSESSPAPGLCGMGPTDWCAAPPGDPCGAHKNVASCRADPRCTGMSYRGESVVACQFDDAGYATNCPTVGCISVGARAP